MMELKVNGKQEFMGKEIPVVLGGFGENQKVVADNIVSVIHNMKPFHVRESINKNIKRFKEGIDFIDLKQPIVEVDTLNLLIELGYSKQSITQAKNIYILSERGYAKLIKIMNSDLAWEIHDKLIDEYFEIIDNARNITREFENIEFKGNIEGLVYSKDGIPMTTSVLIAKTFEKNHKEILRLIDLKLNSKEERVAQFCATNIKETLYLANDNRYHRQFELTEEGFSFIALGLTGSKADIFKIEYIKAFSKMKKGIQDMFKVKLIESILPQDNRLRQYVYIIENVDNGAIKIGVGNNPEKRLKQLQTGSVSELELVYTSYLCSNAFEIEKIVHKKFEKYHIRGEWYKLSKNTVIKYLEEQNYVLKSEFMKFLY